MLLQIEPASFEHAELLTLVMGLSVLGFALFERRRIGRTVGSTCLLLAFTALVASWAASILEGLVAPVTLDMVQHVCEAAGAALLAVWCFLVTDRSQEAIE